MGSRLNRGRLVRLALLLALAGCGRRSESPPSAQAPAVTPETLPAPAVMLPDSIEFVARGNEPFWAITVSSVEILFQEPDRIEGIHARPTAPIRSGARLVFRTELRDSVPIPLELTLEEKPCQDSMSGFPFAYTATAQVGDRRFDGCGERRRRAATGAIP